MLKETPKQFLARSAETFSRHRMRRENGWCWVCRRRSEWIYGFRVVWMPGALAMSGDLGTMVVSHYSFTDPWAAAAWVNGAGWSYFMEKTGYDKVYDSERTAELIVESAYDRVRYDRTNLRLFERIIEHTSIYGDASEPHARKEACREIMNGDLLESDAYDITGDPEMLLYSHRQAYQWNYAAMRWWAAKMWESEPMWHKAVRQWRRLRAVRKRLRDHPIVFAPILFGHFRSDGKIVTFNGATFWSWDKTSYGRAYRGVYPWRIGRLDLSRWLGLWRRQGSVWPDSTTIPDRTIDDRDWHWRPLTIAQTHELLASGRG